MKRWTILLIAFISCGNHSGEASQSYGRPKRIPDSSTLDFRPADPFRFRACVPFDSTIIDGPDSLLKAAVIRSFPRDLESVKSTQVLSISLVKGTIPCGDLGVCQVYKVNLSPELPEVMEDTLFLLVSRSTGKAALFPLASLHPFQLTPQDSVSLIGGIFMSRGKGFFMVYRYNGRNGFDLVFDTKDLDCPASVPVYNSSLDCISYDPFELKLEVADANGDGINDLIFTGKVLFFCKGLEQGYGRTDREPLRTKALKIVFQAAENAGYPAWKLQDTSICRLLVGK